MTTFQCPACGKQLEVTEVQGGRLFGLVRKMTHARRRRRVPGALGASAFSPPVREFDEASFRQPARPATFESDVIVPLAQSAITGGIVGICTGLSIKALGYGQMLLGGGVVGLLSFGASWWYLLQDSRRLLWQIEELINKDINHDQQIGPPARIEIESVEHAPGRKHPVTHYDTLPLSRDDLNTLRKLAQADLIKWSTRALYNAETLGLSQTEAKDLLGAMLNLGYLRYRDNNPNHPDGAELTAKGKALLLKGE